MSPITGAGAEPSSSAARPQQLMLPACPEHSHPGHPRRPLDALPPSQCPEAALLLALETYRRPSRPLLPPARAPETAGRDVGKNARMAHAIWLAYCAEARGSAHGPKELPGEVDAAALRQLAREGVRQLRAAFGPWSPASRDLLGAGTRLAWAAFGCAADAAV